MRNLAQIKVLSFCLWSLSVTTIFAAVSPAQEMEPRAYSRAPVGTQTVITTYTFQTGDVSTDNNVPLRDVSARINSAAFGYARTFGLAGRQFNVGIAIPYFKGRVKGDVFEQQQEITRSGLGDARVKLSLMLRGAPAMTPKEFAAFKPKMILGVGLTVVAPTGQYDPQRLINLGSNRWAFKPEVGASKTLKRWTLEAAAGVWLFSPNRKFFGDSQREQKPLLSLQTHAIYTFRPRMWLALSGTYYNGGRTVVNGVLNPDMQNNTRVGSTFAYPITRRHSLKISAFRGVTTRIGSNMSALSVGWQYTWF